MRISGDSGGNELCKTPASPLSMDHRYRRHEPEKTALYPIIEQHLSTLADELTRHQAALPAFVIDEFRNYLRCGRLKYGFIRVKCDGCRHEHLVAFSCKRRGFCPSCGARRMIETSAHLVDHVIPDVPVRQWVLSFPWPLRLLFASRPDALSRSKPCNASEKPPEPNFKSVGSIC
jgi:ribosomal protein S27E